MCVWQMNNLRRPHVCIAVALSRRQVQTSEEGLVAARGGVCGFLGWGVWVGRTLQSRERERHRPPRSLPALFP